MICRIKLDDRRANNKMLKIHSVWIGRGKFITEIKMIIYIHFIRRRGDVGSDDNNIRCFLFGENTVR